MGDVVKVAALRAAAKELEKEGGPSTYLENAKVKLQDARLASIHRSSSLIARRVGCEDAL
jgi:hypothetical protein